MSNPIYFPIFLAKAGEIEAIGRLSPQVQALTCPILDIPLQKRADRRTLEAYLNDKVLEILHVWGNRYPLYLDLSRHEPEATLSNGRPIAEYLFELARLAKLNAVPVAGPLSIRGPSFQYLDSVARIAGTDRRGIALRLPTEYFSTEEALAKSIAEPVRQLSVSAADMDVVLDVNAIPLGDEDLQDHVSLAAMLRRATLQLHDLGVRKVIFCGSNLPDGTVRHRKGEFLKIPRIEYRVWRSLAPDFPDLGFGDYGVTHPRQSEPDGPVIPPSRVRITTDDEYELWKGGRDEIRSVCASAVDSGSLSRDSWGASAVRECAAGYGNPGAAKDWVAHDTNMHVTATVNSMFRILPRLVATGSYERRPWLQDALDLWRDN